MTTASAKPLSSDEYPPIRTQILDLPLCTTSATCKGRTFIVTGANTGLGYEAVKHLILAGAARVIMACRSTATGEAAKAEILSSIAADPSSSADSNAAETELHVWPLDLSSYASVKSFAARAEAELERLDVVIQNAGIAASDGELRPEGHRINTTVNVLGTLLLGLLLLPQMARTGKAYYAAGGSGDGALRPHMTFVSSGAGFEVGQAVWESVKEDPIVRLDTLGVAPMVYPQSKILLIQALRFFASRVAPLGRTGVVLNVLSPGLCTTQLDRYAPPAFREQIAKDRQSYGRTAEQGSRTLLHGAVAGPESHGKYLSDCRIAEDKLPSWLATDDGERSWQVVAEELEKAVPGCVEAATAL
ncbi:uncharacterized protein B0I36DRAFT_358630 [Microdochium trichocladiopsis]|uniref:Short-chain dehydrogenase n=1 Tax=Microdochium trichocladiopsis TaxID=1682393 RepID=A0A9P8YJB9_9PEZI|nr:uncharacterized protein B0I36DRAFT_358630 [Microdochium trichocladiopsis]KAH7041464.1 hypothetical protein B0I36DRAFT_358630 [Microdochium trichocladiopsis]